MTKTHVCPVLVLVALLGGCEPERPPAPDRAPDAKAAPRQSVQRFVPNQTAAILTYAGDRGRFVDTNQLDEVPEDARGLVRVTLLGGAAPPAGAVWVANLAEPDADGSYPLQTVPRDLFEELALGTGRKSAVELPEGLDPPKVIQSDGIVVYKTEWCGVCKKVQAYLDRKGVPYVAKDIEKDRDAAAELQTKARQKGIGTGSVPIIDVHGELIVGFDRKRLEDLLGAG